jgi:hypothetical protein
MRAELFDGTILEFPEGTSPEVISRVAKEQTELRRNAQPAPQAATAPAQAAPTQEPGWMESVFGPAADATAGVVDQSMRGLAGGVTNILGLPRMLMEGKNYAVGKTLGAMGVPDDTAEFIANLDPSKYLLPSAEGMQAAGDTFNNTIADTLGLERPRTETRNIFERFGRRTGEEVGAMAVPAAGILGLAARTTPQAARKGGWLSRMFVEPAAVNPGRFVQNETRLATGAGLGASTANEMVDPNTTAGQIADFTGAVGGAGITGLATGFYRQAGDLKNALLNRGAYADDVVKNEVVDRIAGNAGLSTKPGEPVDVQPLIDQIEAGPRISRVVPGVQESLADRTANPGIASLEYSRQTGKNSGLFNQRRTDNAKAVDDVLSQFEPQSNPAALRGELELERGRRLTDAEVQAQNAADAARRAVEPLTPAGTPAARGNTIREALDTARETARQATSDAYDVADVANNPVDAAGLIDTLDRSVAKLTEAERSLLPESLINRIRRLGGTQEPPTDTGILDASGRPIMRDAPPPEPVRLKEAADLRSELNRLASAAASDPRAERGGRNANRVLTQMSRDVDAFIQRSITPEERQALEAARGARFEEGENFGRQLDPVSRALAAREGRYVMNDENVARSFTNTRALDRLLAQADTPEVRASIRDEMLSRVDTSKPGRIQDFLQANTEQIDRFPGLRGELETAARARTDEAAATTRRAEMEADLGTPERRGAGTVGRYLSYTDATSDRAMSEVLNARDPAKAADDLLTFVGDDAAAVEGARSALWKAMERQSRAAGETTAIADGRQPWRPKALKRWLDTPANRAVAERFYRDNPEHLDNIDAIAAALQGLDTRNSGRVPNTSGSAQGIAPSAETLASRSFAYQRGQVGGAFLGVTLGTVMARKAVRNAQADGIERLLDDVLLNPDTAALLMRENNPANRAALKRKAKLWFGNEVNTIMNLIENEAEEQDPVKEAIGGNP